MSEPSFRVGITSDLLDARGEPAFDRTVLRSLDEAPGLAWEWLPAGLRQIGPDHAAGFDALYVNAPRVPASIVHEGMRLKLVARHGVGYDSVDVTALASAGVLVTNTPNAVARPVATIALLFILALSHRLREKDRLAREDRWGERLEYMGQGLTGRTLGVVGAGRIGKELLRMARAFDLRLLAADPYGEPVELSYIGARLLPLGALMAAADFVAVTCPLNEETRHLVDAKAIGLMKRTAYLINVARGPVVDERALHEALAAGRIAGAGLDVFEEEPTPASNPLLALDNVVATPHSLCWTDELFGNIARTAIAGILELHGRRRPGFLVDERALDPPRIRGWLHL